MYKKALSQDKAMVKRIKQDTGNNAGSLAVVTSSNLTKREFRVCCYGE